MVQSFKLELNGDLPCVTNAIDNSIVKIFKDRMLCAFTSIKEAFYRLHYFLFDEWPPTKNIKIGFCNGYYTYRNLVISEDVLVYMKNRCLENRRYRFHEAPLWHNK